MGTRHTVIEALVSMNYRGLQQLYNKNKKLKKRASGEVYRWLGCGWDGGGGGWLC